MAPSTAGHGFGWVEEAGRGTQIVSAIRIVPLPLHLLMWNGNVLPVFAAFRVDVAINGLDFSRVALRVIATANRRIIGHVPF